MRLCWLLLVPLVQSFTLPPYIKTCSRSDPSYKQCCLENAKIAIPEMTKGDKKYKIPNMDPMRITEIRVSQGPKQAGINLVMQDVKMYGLKDCTPILVDIDDKKRHVTNTLASSKMEILGKYEITGRLLILPINGKGDLNITLVNSNVTFFGDFDVVNDTMILKNSGTNLDPIRAYIHLTNLFGGDKFLGAQMNQFMDDNWRDVYNEMSPTIEEAFGNVVQSVFNGFTVSFPYSVLFPE